MLETPPAHWTTDPPDWSEPIEDIAGIIACEAASDWGLDLADIGTRVKVWGLLERYAQDVVQRALGQLDLHPDDIDWNRVAELTEQPTAAAARTHYPPK